MFVFVLGLEQLKVFLKGLSHSSLDCIHPVLITLFLPLYYLRMDVFCHFMSLVEMKSFLPYLCSLTCLAFCAVLSSLSPSLFLSLPLVSIKEWLLSEARPLAKSKHPFRSFKEFPFPRTLPTRDCISYELFPYLLHMKTCTRSLSHSLALSLFLSLLSSSRGVFEGGMGG